jgi:hypothetical protein
MQNSGLVCFCALVKELSVPRDEEGGAAFLILNDAILAFLSVSNDSNI